MPSLSHISILVTLILSSVACTSVPTRTPQVIIETRVINSTPGDTATPNVVVITNTPTPTLTQTLTPTPVPTLEGLSIPVPDPRITNPELFDLDNSFAPIPQFVNAMRLAGIELTAEQVIEGFHAEMETPQELPPFLTYRTSDGAILIIGEQDLETQKWQWNKATATRYWRLYGKYLGYGMKPRYRKRYSNYLNLSQFRSGLLALTDAPGDPVSDARSFLQTADKNDMAFLLHYMIEPGKFPKGITEENVEGWLDDGLEQTAQLIIQNNTSSAPVMVGLNEPWHYKNVGQWNPEQNPLRDKYGDAWLTEWCSRTVQILTEKHGLKLNQDYIIVVNDGTGLSTPAKLEPIHRELSEIQEKLSQQLEIDRTDVKIILGLQLQELQTPTETIGAVADQFADLGGILLTEVNPRENQREYLRSLATLVHQQNVYGLYLWKTVPEPDSDKYDDHWVLLLDDNGLPTVNYFEFLR